MTPSGRRAREVTTEARRHGDFNTRRLILFSVPPCLRGENASTWAAEHRTMNRRVDHELQIERRAHHVALAHEDRLAAERREDFDARAGADDPRRADEDERQRIAVVSRLEAVDL